MAFVMYTQHINSTAVILLLIHTYGASDVFIVCCIARFRLMFVTGHECLH